MRLAYFCADFDSPYKAYFPRQVRGFRSLDVTVYSWDVDLAAVDGIRRVQIPTEWNQSGIGPRLAQKLRRFGFPAGLATGLEIRCIADLLDPADIDLAFLHTGFVAARVAPALQRRGIPYAIQCHGGDVREAMAVSGWGRMFGSICRDAAAVLVVGSHMIDQVVSLGVDASKVVLEPMGAPVKDRRVVQCLEWMPPFVVVGRLVPCKSIDTVILAVDSTPTDSGVAVRIIGDGPLRSTLERLVRTKGLEERVEFVGTIPADEVAREIDRSAGLVISTVDEPGGPEAFGVVCTEAMAAERPVIASRCGGLLDQVVGDETGILFDQRDHLALGRAMARLAADPKERARMGAAGRQRALAMFDASERAVAVEEILLHLNV